jgi:hypothetical protein
MESYFGEKRRNKEKLNYDKNKEFHYEEFMISPDSEFWRCFNKIFSGSLSWVVGC